MDKVLGIFCHPDDEVLAGWPIFQSDAYEKYLMICCDDYARKGPSRREALRRVCKQEGITLVRLLSENNNFYSLPTRRADSLLTHSVFRINNAMEQAIESIKPDYIITHNPVGEYGHGSHRLLFEIVTQHPITENILITDICQVSNHRSSASIPEIIYKAYYEDNIIGTRHLDIDFYNRCKAIYDLYQGWTWNKEPIEECNLHLLKDTENV
jgi:hypothetical protein